MQNRSMSRDCLNNEWKKYAQELKGWEEKADAEFRAKGYGGAIPEEIEILTWKQSRDWLQNFDGPRYIEWLRAKSG